MLNITAIANAKLPQPLKNALGTYTTVESDAYFCSKISAIDIREDNESKNDIVVEVLLKNGNVVEKLIPGINTNKVYPVSTFTASIVQRYVFKNNQLKIQEKSSFAGFLSSGFKDKSVLLKIIDRNTVQYSYTEYITCTFQR